MIIVIITPKLCWSLNPLLGSVMSSLQSFSHIIYTKTQEHDFIMLMWHLWRSSLKKLNHLFADTLPGGWGQHPIQIELIAKPPPFTVTMHLLLTDFVSKYSRGAAPVRTLCLTHRQIKWCSTIRGFLTDLTLRETAYVLGRQGPRKQASTRALWLVPLLRPVDAQSLNSQVPVLIFSRTFKHPRRTFPFYSVCTGPNSMGFWELCGLCISPGPVSPKML